MFGIPGDSITAIVIGVLYLKGLNPGPTIFIENAPDHLRRVPRLPPREPAALPLGWGLIKIAKNVLHVPRSVLMPVILLFCVVGAFAINNSVFDVGVMLVFGLVAYFMEANGFPIAPTILGLVLGGMLEQNFVTSMIKAEGTAGILRAADRRESWRRDGRHLVDALVRGLIPKREVRREVLPDPGSPGRLPVRGGTRLVPVLRHGAMGRGHRHGQVAVGFQAARRPWA